MIRRIDGKRPSILTDEGSRSCEGLAAAIPARRSALALSERQTGSRRCSNAESHRQAAKHHGDGVDTHLRDVGTGRRRQRASSRRSLRTAPSEFRECGSWHASDASPAAQCQPPYSTIPVLRRQRARDRSEGAEALNRKARRRAAAEQRHEDKNIARRMVMDDARRAGRSLREWAAKRM